MNNRQYTTQPSVIGIGLITLDIVVSAHSKHSMRQWAGGTCGNVLTILSYLGWASYPVANLNGDGASQSVKRDMIRWGVRLDYADASPGGETPIITQKITRNRLGHAEHRFSWSCPDCGKTSPRYKPVRESAVAKVAAQLRSPSVFFFDRVSTGALKLARECANNGGLVVFEPSGVGNPSLFKEAVSLAHILKYSKERIDKLNFKLSTRCSNYIEIQTLGSRGLRYRTHTDNASTRGWRTAKPHMTNHIADTAGCGDWTTAGIIAKLAKNGLKGLQKARSKDIERAVSYGQALAAWNCGFEGARGGMYQVNKKLFQKQIESIVKEAKSTVVEQNKKLGTFSAIEFIPH